MSLAEVTVETRDLVRIYKPGKDKREIVGLAGVSLRIEPGAVHGLLGPNGAGKTTLVKILSTILTPTSGSATVCGFDVVRQTKQVRERIGTVFGGERGLYQHLTGRENLEHWGALYGIKRGEARTQAEKLLQRVGLASRADDLAETYSRGMKQRLHLARGLINDASVLFLDEPTIGMDPVAARDFRSLITDLRGEGRTILLTTHDMAEAEAVCDRVALLKRGKVIALETPKSLARLVAQFERIEFFGGSASVVDAVQKISGVERVEDLTSTGGHRVVLDERGTVKPVVDLLLAAGISSFRTSPPTLEEVYLHLLSAPGQDADETDARFAEI